MGARPRLRLPGGAPRARHRRGRPGRASAAAAVRGHRPRRRVRGARRQAEGRARPRSSPSSPACRRTSSPAWADPARSHLRAARLPDAAVRGGCAALAALDARPRDDAVSVCAGRRPAASPHAGVADRVGPPDAGRPGADGVRPGRAGRRRHHRRRPPRPRALRRQRPLLDHDRRGGQPRPRAGPSRRPSWSAPTASGSSTWRRSGSRSILATSRRSGRTWRRGSSTAAAARCG